MELTIPHDFEAEQALLGAIIINNKLMDEIASILNPDHFFAESHRQIYGSMLYLWEDKQPLDEISIGDKLKQKEKLEEIGGYLYLSDLIAAVPSSGNFIYYAKVIEEKAILRSLISICSDTGTRARDPKENLQKLLSRVESRISELAQSRSEKQFVHIIDAVKENIAELEYLTTNNIQNVGLPTGFRDLDRFMSGLLPGDLIVIAARPSMGKTALALNIAAYIASTISKEVVTIHSREMAFKKVSRRILASLGSINTHFLKTGLPGTDNSEMLWDKLGRATDILKESNILINDKTSSVIQACNQVKAQNRKQRVCLSIFDYMQLMDYEQARNREQEIAGISRRLKGLATDLNIPVIALSQLNRSLESRNDKHPQLSDLRESGSIEQDADIILFLYREDYYHKGDDEYQPTGIVDVEIGKHREGPTGMINLVFDGKYTKFNNLSISGK